MYSLRRSWSGILLIAVACALALFGASTASSSVAVQGDADCSGNIAVGDAADILSQAAGAGVAACASSADTNCDNHVDVLDALNVLLFASDITTTAPEYCDDMGAALSPVRIKIDLSLGTDRTVDSLDGGDPVPVVVARDANGGPIQYVGNEVVYKPDNPADLQAFLAAHNGTVLRDGKHTIGPDATVPVAKTIDDGTYLIRIDPSTMDLDDLAGDLGDGGMAGDVAFSSEAAARVMAIAAGDPDGNTSVSGLGEFGMTQEQDLGSGSYLDADNFEWFKKGNSLNIGVTAAWQYLRYQNIVQAPDAIPFQAVRVAILDTGFSLNSVTGTPSDGNLDYFPPGGLPAQYDPIDDDYRPGGHATIACGAGPGACPWHGTGAFGVCCAIPNNQYGGAGTGGNFVVPILIRIDDRVWTWAEAIQAAEVFEADVISMSFSYSCWSWCGWFDGDIGDYVDAAGQNGRIQVAAAGNTLSDTGQPGELGGDEHKRPCEFVRVICVGGMSLGQFNLRNWGGPVDIHAPEGIWGTVTPETAAKDADNVGTDELINFGGTSAATPFVAGVVALMRGLNPGLTYVGALDLLAATANASANDPGKVTNGYVNALAAVLATKPNLPPVINDVPVPQAKATYSYSGVTFRVLTTDPEPGAYKPEFDLGTLVTFTANGQVLCVTQQRVYFGPNPGYQCTVNNAPIGTYDVIVTVTDPFGGQATARLIDVEFVNTPPIVDLLEPEDGETFYATQSIEFGAYVFDAEETIPFPQGYIVWSSDIQGVLGAGSSIETNLIQGTHVITVSATDGKGVTVSDSVTLNVLSGVGVPTVVITQPEHHSYWGVGQPITFTGFADDTEDGPITGDNLDWYSDQDGYLGSGETITTTLTGFNCFNYDHVITLVATDSDAHEVSDRITITVGSFC